MTPRVARRTGAAALVVAATSMFLLARCGDEPSPQPSPGTPSPSSTDDVATFAQILVVYRSAMKPDWPRTKEAALERAQDAIRHVRSGKAIEDVTAELTDDRDTSGRPTNSGTVTIRRNASWPIASVRDAVFRLKPGDLLPSPLDTGVAYLVIRRED